MNSGFGNVDEYLASVSPEARATLEGLREKIRALAPDAVESISYGMAGYKYKGRPLVYFAAWKDHCALYGTSQGTIRFPTDEPPLESLLQTLLSERMAEIEASGKR